MNDTITRFGSGQSVLRIEDDKLLKGLGRFTDDLTPDSLLRAFSVSTRTHRVGGYIGGHRNAWRCSGGHGC